VSRARLPIVVVGGGIAGLVTALAAAPSPVRLLCRARDGSASALAQGGIAAALDPADSAQAHAHDTLQAGARHNDVAMVQWLAGNAPAAIAWLQIQGVAFDATADGQLQLGREGGHAAARIVHAGGDASGAALIRALQAKTGIATHIQPSDGVDVDALLLRNGRVGGVRARDADGRLDTIEASAVVLATGGIGALFARTSNPPGADGSGLALGMAAGAMPRDLEFVQFHPTALDVVSPRLPLITEALRGAGARLLNAAGQPLMAGLHPLGDLAPRDVVALCAWDEQRAGGQVWLDATAVAGDWTRRFPTVLAACLAHGIDPRSALIPVTPAAHFHMGGLATDTDGRTSVPGLYAVGEVACNGVHGANRLASNSLLEGVLCGRRLGALLAGQRPRWHDPVPARWRERGPSLDPNALTALRKLLWTAAGPVREATGLRDAWRICHTIAPPGWQAGLAKALLRSALLRKRSLGAHCRRDRGCPG
jgi:L-aspartate oxidase